MHRSLGFAERCSSPVLKPERSSNRALWSGQGNYVRLCDCLLSKEHPCFTMGLWANNWSKIWKNEEASWRWEISKITGDSYNRKNRVNSSWTHRVFATVTAKKKFPIIHNHMNIIKNDVFFLSPFKNCFLAFVIFTREDFASYSMKN